MKKALLVIAALLIFHTGYSQITITSADMPVAGDTLRYSIASPASSTFSPADSGASFSWSYALTPISQAVDTYQTAISVNIFYAALGITAYGYKVADSLPTLGALPISIHDVYTFFEKVTTAKYEAKAFAANISGLPTPIDYSVPDVWYFFPLGYTNNDSSNFALNIAIPSLGGIKEVGYRKSRVDGWGTIATPYFTTPANCIRIRSEIHQIDSVTITGLATIGFPANTVEYKWLVNGEHYPALWITTTVPPGGGAETVSSIMYRDTYRSFDTANTTAIRNATKSIQKLNAYPNPSANGIVTIDVPADWSAFYIRVMDLQSRQVAMFNNQRQINISSLPAGQYLCQVSSGSKVAYVQLTR